MEMVAPSGPVYQAGTLSGNPLAMAAGLATLRALDEPVYEVLERRSARLAQGIIDAAQRYHLPLTINRVGSMLTLFWTKGPVINFLTAKSQDVKRFVRFHALLLERGIYAPSSAFEAWFVSLAHDEAIIEETIEKIADALHVLSRETNHEEA